jgi:hypothetical protein
VLGVLVSLLFSVGEGLRLSPFPSVNDPSKVTVATLEQNTLVPGPLGVPVQVVKRAQRHSLHIDVPPRVDTFQSQVISLDWTETQLHRVSPFSGSLCSGRAPPGLS